MTFSFVLCKPSGEPYGELLGCKARQITRVVNGPASATVAVQLGDPFAGYMLPGAYPRMKVWRSATPAEVAADPSAGRQLLFYGSLPTSGFKADAASDTLQATFYDPSWILGRRYALGTESYTSVDQGLVLWNLLAVQNARTGGDTWIRQGATTTGTLLTRAFARALLAQLFTDLSKAGGGPDFTIQPLDYWSVDGTRAMGNLNVYASQGIDRPNAVFGYSGSSISNVQNAQLSYLDPTTLATATGKDAMNAALSATLGNPDAGGLGLLEQLFADQDVSTLATLAAKAGGIIAEQASLRPVITISGPLPDAPQPFVDYDLGDTVRTAINRGAFFQNTTPRVMGFSVTIDQDGAVDTALVLANAPGIYVPAPAVPSGGGGILSAGTAKITIPHASTLSATSRYEYAEGYFRTVSPGRSMFPTETTEALVYEKCITGLTVGATYTVSAWVRGDDNQPGTGTAFAIFVNDQAGSTGAQFSADDSFHIWNSTAATRKAWAQLSVTFVATATSMYAGWRALLPFEFNQRNYTSDWTVTA